MARNGYKHPSQKAGPYTPTRGKFAGFTFRSYRNYQSAHAKAKGFSSSSTRLASPKKPTKRLLGDAGGFAKSTAGRANRAVLELRRDPDLTLAAAAKRAKTTPAAVRRYAGSSLERKGNRVAPKAFDHAVVPMGVLTPEGHVVGLVRGRKTHQLIGHHDTWINAVINSPSPANIRQLAKFERRSVTFADGTRVRMVWNLEQIQDLVRRGLYNNSGPYDTSDMAVAA